MKLHPDADKFPEIGKFLEKLSSGSNQHLQIPFIHAINNILVHLQKNPGTGAPENDLGLLDGS